MTKNPVCELCGEPMPEGEGMFKYHGYSGDCPKPPLKKSPEKEFIDTIRNQLIDQMNLSFKMIFTPTEKPMEWEEEFDKKLDIWLASTDHLYDCIGYSEGQLCCLDDTKKGRIWVKDFIRQLLKAERERIMKEIEKIIKHTNWIEEPKSAYGQLIQLLSTLKK